MKSLSNIFSSVLILLVLANSVAVNQLMARDFFVNNQSGDDRNDGLSPKSTASSGPVRTIAKALRLATGSDQVVLANTGEPYRESITLHGRHQSGVKDHPFAIRGNGATLDGTRAVPDNSWQHVKGNIFRFQPKRLHFQQLFIGGKPAVRLAAPAATAKLPDFRTSTKDRKGTEGQWCLFKQHIYFHVADGHPPQSYKARYANLPVGITIYQVHDVAVVDLDIVGFQLDGVNAHDGVFRGYLAGLACVGNGRSGISIGGASRVTVEACLMEQNGTVQLRTEGACRANVTKCNVVASKAPQYQAPQYQVTGGKLWVDKKLIPKTKK